jgi:exodeoxyribonuclease-3
MKELKLLSWNVNGIRAVDGKGIFKEVLNRESPDVLCVQETKARPEQLGEALVQPDGYRTYWNYPVEKKGYSGVAVFTRDEPLDVQHGFGVEEFDSEGRTIIVKYPGFTLFNIYFPKGDTAEARAFRLTYKLDFYKMFLDYADSLKRKGERLVICGDFNTAHNEIDLARPKENEKVSGFLPVEREWIDTFISHGYIDTFRHFNAEPGHYTWWDFKTRARERNVGWRLDYFFVTEDLVGSVSKAFILPEVMGSDHCPVGITLMLQ